ncbi:MAG: class I SAM-dependent methyltransferase [Bdellovibrionota bacterium]
MHSCRICHSQTSFINDFGKMPIANGFLTPQQYKDEHFFRLHTAFCSRCKMFQLIDQPEPEMMFHENYAFFSSTSKKMGSHFEKMADSYLANFIPNEKEAFVVELGSNDGIMLKHFAKRGIKHLGVEPSSNVAEIARQSGVNSISFFFGAETAAKVHAEYGKADIISAANVMCHIPDLDSVGRGVSTLLKDKGVFVFEDPYLGDVIQKTSYDQIYDEHVWVFSVQSVANAFGPHGLEVFHVEPQVTHGGSMRYYLCKKGAHSIRSSVRDQLTEEMNLGLDKLETYKKFEANCEESKARLLTILKELKSQGKRVVGYAATSKSTTVLNYCGIGPDLVEFISDTTPIKQGKMSPGMHIPVKAYQEFKSNYPDYALLFAWNHAAEVFENEKDFVAKGGKWLVFVPEVKVLS